jgi:hypothetical protein
MLSRRQLPSQQIKVRLPGDRGTNSLPQAIFVATMPSIENRGENRKDKRAVATAGAASPEPARDPPDRLIPPRPHRSQHLDLLLTSDQHRRRRWSRRGHLDLPWS